MIPAKKKKINANIPGLHPNLSKSIKSIIKSQKIPETEEIKVVANKEKNDKGVEATIKKKDLEKEVNKKILKRGSSENKKKEIKGVIKKEMKDETNENNKEEIRKNKKREMKKSSKKRKKEKMKNLNKSVKKDMNKE